MVVGSNDPQGTVVGLEGHLPARAELSSARTRTRRPAEFHRSVVIGAHQSLGVYANVVTPGDTAVGDEVRLLE